MAVKPNIVWGDDIVQSVASAFQYISYYHPTEYISRLTEAYKKEKSPTAKNAMAEVLVNSRMAALGKRPICHNTSAAIVFAKMKSKRSSIRSILFPN